MGFDTPYSGFVDFSCGSDIIEGAHAVSEYSQIVLLGTSFLAFLLAMATGAFSLRGLKVGFARSARQILPAVPMLVFIAMVATTWMAAGVVPTMIKYGLGLLDPTLFLVTTCAIVLSYRL